MALTRDFRITIAERAKREPAFAEALMQEAMSLLFKEPETARLILRDLVNATVGFEELAKVTDTPPKSLHRMLSASGNPTQGKLVAIVDALTNALQLVLDVKVKKMPQKVAMG